MKKEFIKLITYILFPLTLLACGPEGEDHLYNNPYDHLFNDQPETGVISVLSDSDKSGVDINPVTLSWNWSDNDGLEGTLYKMDDGEWTWTTETFAVYSALDTGIHTFHVKVKDTIGAIDQTPAEVTFEVDATAPKVSSTAPRYRSYSVAPNAIMSATFSESMQGFLMTTSVFSLKDSFGTDVSGTVRYDYTTMTFDAALFNNETYTATISSSVEDEVGNLMVSDFSWNFVTGNTDDTEAPLISSTKPVSNSIDAAPDSALTATFSEPMAPFSITTSTFTLKDNNTGNPVPGSLFYSGLTAAFIPDVSLSAGSAYAARLSTAVTDLAGLPLANFLWSFVAGGGSDVTPPNVSSTSPRNNADTISGNSAIIATFNESVDVSTITNSAFVVKDDNDVEVPGAVYYSGRTAAFIPYTALESNQTYSGTVLSDIKDLAGNSLTSNYSWNFVTGPDFDDIPPSVSSVMPQNMETDIPVNAVITVDFSEPVDAYTVSAGNFILEDDWGAKVDGAVTYSGRTAAFKPYTLLPDDTRTWTATIKSGINDLAGNSMTADFIWSFDTGSDSDNTAPIIYWTFPAEGAEDVDVGTIITATFSEAMTVSTISTDSFTIYDVNNQAVPGAVEGLVRTAIFIPFNPLNTGEIYTATLSTEILDRGGNSLEEDYSWSFTASFDDVTPPTVTFKNPTGGETAVTEDIAIIAEFSEPMDPSTITTENFFLHDGFNFMEGNVYYDGDVTAVFTPISALPPTTYTATIQADVMDLAGNAMASYTSISFTTVATPDTTPPVILSTTPVNAEIDVGIDRHIYVTFSEMLDSSTVHDLSITLNEVSGPVVAGAVHYDGLLTAIFKPSSYLFYQTAYKLTVDATIKDVAGNYLAADQYVTFTTGSVPVNTASSIAAGSFHSMAINNDFTVWAWGGNIDGQLGDGTIITSISPVQTSIVVNATAIEAGDAHSVALLADKTVWTWGDNYFGQLGIGIGPYDTSIHSLPAHVSTLPDIISVAAGYQHTLALDINGNVWAWGLNGDGQLGVDVDTIPYSSSPVPVPGLSGVVAIAAGYYHSLALKGDGSVWAWGDNNFGQLGNDLKTDSSVPVPTSGLVGVSGIAAGWSHSLAMKADGTVFAWGDNFFGQLGDWTNTERLTPVPVLALADITAISAGQLHSLALKSDDSVWSWGFNYYGQLGDGSSGDGTNKNSPVQTGLTGVKAIAGGDSHSLALKADGTAWGWGDNTSGQLGDGTTTNSPVPVLVNW